MQLRSLTQVMREDTKMFQRTLLKVARVDLSFENIADALLSHIRKGQMNQFRTWF
jgi:hypothetical protein